MRGKLSLLPAFLRDDLVAGWSDYEEHFVGFVVLDMGQMGVDAVSGPIDLDRLAPRVLLLKSELGVASQSEIAEIMTTDWHLPPS